MLQKPQQDQPDGAAETPEGELGQGGRGYQSGTTQLSSAETADTSAPD